VSHIPCPYLNQGASNRCTKGGHGSNALVVDLFNFNRLCGVP
jgi:hypothetical protein